MPCDQDDMNITTSSESPIERADDASNFELNVTQLSLPDSFDESMCLDMYNDLIKAKSKHSLLVPSGCQCETLGGNNVDNDAASLPGGGDSNLEMKVRQLMAANLELKEKCHRSGQSRQSSTNYERIIDELRSQLAQQTALHDIVSKREKELQHQILEHKRKMQILSLDLEHAQNEAKTYLQRAEKAEHDSETIASSLKSIQHKYDVSISRRTTEQEEVNRETSRIREECKKEIATSRTQQSEAFARESMLLRDALDHAKEQAKTLQQDLNDLRYDRDSREAEYQDINKELERQLSDVRSELKVKCHECNTHFVESNRLKEESKETLTALAQLRNEYASLERRTDIERSKSEQIIRQKCELLEIYQHEDLLIEDGDESGEAGDAGHTLSGRKSLLRNSIALASKCRKLQSALKQTGDELAIEQEKNQLLNKKNQSNQRLFNVLASQTKKTTTSCMVSAIKIKDKEIFELSSKLNMLQLELSKMKQERDDCSTRLTEVVERRNKVTEMKALVDSIRSSIVAPVCCPHCKRQSESIDDGDDEDMLDHVVHHGVSNLH